MKAISVLAGAILAAQVVLGDIVECDNGDRYNGKVLSMDEKKVTLQNEIAGTVSIPRDRIVSISFRNAQVTRKTVVPTTSTNAAPRRAGAIQFDSKALQQVQNEMLAGASPEANRMFQEMVQGLASGHLKVGDICSQARTTLQELRELQNEAGDSETAELLNAYGSILEGFLQQSTVQTNAPVPVP